MIWQVVDDEQLSSTAQQMALHFAPSRPLAWGLSSRPSTPPKPIRWMRSSTSSVITSVWPDAAMTIAKA
jgi:hypothetical protein